MPDPLSTDEGEERSSTKDNFVGRIVTSEANSDEYGGSSEYRDEDATYYDHLYEIDVLSEDWDNVHVFSLEVNNNFNSKWMLAIGHLQKIHGDLQDDMDVHSLDELGEFLEDGVYQFREIGFTEDEEFSYPGVDQTVNFMQMFSGSENQANPLIVPVEEVTDEERLEELGQDTPTEIDDDVEL
jgi:hypothetical protein